MPEPDYSAMLRWPNVPACYGWLSLDRRGRWRLRGEPVSHRGLSDFLGRRYAHDEQGNYFVQNGPQRVFVELEYTPWVLRLSADNALETHVGEAVVELRGAALDEDGSLLLEIPDGIALLSDRDLPALLGHLRLANGEPADDAALLAFLDQPDATANALTFVWHANRLPLSALRRSAVAGRYRFVASPQSAVAETRS